MRLGVTEHRVRLGPHEYRLLRVGGLRRALCYDNEHWLSLWVDRRAAAELAAAWLLAARSPRSLVHLPLRRRGERPLGAALPEPHRARDLLLLHHSLQFPASRWKEVRARAGRAGSQHTVEFRRADFPLPHDRAVPGAHHAEFRDRLRLSTAADTLVLSGSALPFADAAADFFDLAETGAGTRPHQGRHVCAELHPGSGLLERSMPLMHVEYCAEWEPVPRDG
ncbi:hypothetical protein ACIGMX_22685 [Streptomyces aquilus]|uniref:hypothetical protein n=1 Tax=Streptomyces aquilus TaxID=2548456 RepID=UPI0037D07BFD